MKRKHETVEPKRPVPSDEMSAGEPAHATEPFEPADAGARHRRIIRAQWALILLLSAALIGSWAPAGFSRWTALKIGREKRALLSKLNSPDAVTRALAARDLKDFKESDVSQALLTHLQDPEWTVRYEVILALGAFGRDDWAPLMVMGYLYDENPHIQDATVAALKQMMAPVTLEPLAITYLYNERLRTQAKAALDALNEPHTSVFMIKALADPDARVRAAAVRGLSYWMPQEGVELLCRSVSDPEAEVRKEAVQSLAQIANDVALEPSHEAIVTGALHDADAGVRQSAVLALAKISSEKHLAEILDARYDSEPAVRIAVARSLKDAKSPDAEQPLLEMLADPDPAVRAAVIASLGERKPIAAVTAIIEKLNDADESVRTQAVRALGALGDARALEPLKDALKKGVAPAYDIISALGDLRRPEAIPLLMEQAHNDDHRLRFTALMAIIKLNTPEVEQKLVEFYKAETRPYVRSDLETAVQKMRAERKKT